MPVWISLLRAVNVGGRSIKMAELRGLYDSLGYSGTKTLLQSGNAVFISDETKAQKLAGEIESAIKDAYGFHSDLIMRSPDEMRRVITNLPFAADRELDPPKLAVTFFVTDLDTASITSIEELMAGYEGPEELHIAGSELYVYYPEGMGRSKLAELLARRKLNSPGTTRNWNTVTKLLALAEAFEES